MKNQKKFRVKISAPAIIVTANSEKEAHQKAIQIAIDSLLLKSKVTDYTSLSDIQGKVDYHLGGWGKSKAVTA